MYKSPIKEVMNNLHDQMMIDYEKGVVRAVYQAGFHVDKEELAKALKYDRCQYEKGYADAMQDMKRYSKTKFLFGDIVVVDEMFIGVVVKTWEDKEGYYYEVYVRSYNTIKEYREEQIERYRVRHKELDEEELGWQNG